MEGSLTTARLRGALGAIALAAFLAFPAAVRGEDVPPPDWRSDASLSAGLRDLLASDAYTRRENSGSWSTAYSAARSDLRSWVRVHAASPGFLDEMARLVAVVDHDSRLPAVILEELDDDQQLRFLASLAADASAPNVPLAMSQALAWLEDPTRPEVPGVLVPVLEDVLIRIDAPFPGRDTVGSSTLMGFREDALRLLTDAFPEDEGFVAYLWRDLAHPDEDAWDHEDRAERARPILAGYRGPRRDEHLLWALGQPDPTLRSLATSIVAEQGGERGVLEATLETLAAFLSPDFDAGDSRLIGDPLGHLQQLGALTPLAVTALLELFAAHLDYHVGNALEAVARERPDHFGADQWPLLLELLEAPQGPCGMVVDVASAVSMEPVTAEVQELLRRGPGERAQWCLPAAVAAQPAPVLAVLMAGSEELQPQVHLALLDGCARRDLDGAWELALLPLLEVDSAEVVGKAYELLHGSQSAEAQVALRAAAPNARSNDAYLELRDGLSLAWVAVPPQELALGDGLSVQLALRNTAYRPIPLPVSLFSLSASWYLEVDGNTLGPLPLGEVNGAVPAEGELLVGVELGELLAAVGPGEHEARVLLLVRNLVMHWPDRRGLRVRSDGLQIRVSEGPGWSGRPEAARAEVNGPTPERRRRGWSRYSPPPPVVAPPEFLRRIAEGDLSRFQGFEMEVGNQGIRTESFELLPREDRLLFRWSWDEEDIGGGTDLELTREEVIRFFRALRDGSPYGHQSVQRWGGVGEREAVVRIRLERTEAERSEDGWYRGESAGPLWLFELENHPRTSRWVEMLLAWKERAEGR